MSIFSEASGQPAVRSRWEAAGVTLIAAAIIGFYAYLSTSHLAVRFAFSKDSTDYYHYLTDGFMDGHLYMKVAPDPQLATLADPYEPMERVRIGHPGWADVSYYKGRYYLYFGAAPALVLFLPFKILTGLHFPEALACALFCAGGYLASLALFLAARRRWFPQCGAGVVWLGALMLGLGNFCAVMLTRAQFYEVPISCAYCFSCAGFALLYLAVCRPPRRRRWLCLASTAFGLAIASRPDFVFEAPVMGLAWLWLGRDRAQEQPSRLGRALAGDAVAAFGPLALTMAGLFAYNYLRFDSPFDFGMRYQLGGNNLSHQRMLAASSIPVNLYYYFAAVARFGRYFPFVDVVRGYSGTVPKGYYGIEDPYGIFVNMPCFWLALLAPAAWLARYRNRRGLGRLMLICGASFAAVCLFTLCFISATNRYMVDFLPPLLLVASLGLLMAWASRLRLLQAGAAVLILYTAWFNAMAAFRHNGLFQHLQPAAYDRIGRWFNYPAGLWDRLTCVPFGPVELTVKLSRQSVGRNEPLMAAGVGVRSDFLYLYHTDAGSVQIGFTHMGGDAGVMSQPIAVDYDEPHRIGIEAGALYPPSSHPYFSRWSAAKIETATHTLRVTVDGVPYLNERQSFFENPPDTLSFGKNPISDYGGRTFNGQLLAVRRRAPEPAIRPFAGESFVRMAFVLPAGRAGGREPLIATGAADKGDLLFIVYDDDEHVRLGFHHAGSEPVMSASLKIVPSRIQVLEASMGSFYAHPQGTELARDLVVRFNARTVWADARAFHSTEGVPASLGVNAWHSEACGAAFSGKMVAVEPVPPTELSALRPRIKPFAGGSFVRIDLALPQGQAGRREPLIATGAAGAGDLLFIAYDDDEHVRLGFHHAGSEPVLSEPLAVASGRPQRIEASLGSFYPPSGLNGDDEWAHALVVKFNGRLIWADERAFHPAAGAPVSLGVNAWHSDDCDAAFSGAIVAVEPLSPRPPSATSAPFVFRPYWLASDGLRYGALRLHVNFPRGQSGKFEPLLVSGPSASKADYVWINYLEEGRLVLGYEHTSGGGPRSRAISVGQGACQVVEIAVPSLYPPEGDAYFAGCPPLTALVAKNRARLSVDGVSWIDAPVGAYESTPAQTTLGENRISATFGRRFTGRISRIERSTWAPPPGFETQTGPLELALTWPDPLPAGTREVILATGAGTGRDRLTIGYEGTRQVRIIVRGHAGNPIASELVNIEPGRRQTVKIAWGGLCPDELRPAAIAPDDWRARQRDVAVWLDGAPVLTGNEDFIFGRPQTVEIGAASEQQPFSGSISSVRRLR